MHVLIKGTSLLLAALTASAPVAIDKTAAANTFAQAHALCAADAGRLWGVSLRGPMMFVDPRTHQAVANQPMPGATRDGSIYRFTLPANTGIANTTVTMHGRRWVQILWPLPTDAAARSVTLMHESFHRVEPQLHLEANVGVGGNADLDTQIARVFFRGELHALRSALLARTRSARIQAVRDAVVMRHYRWSLFPDGGKNEQPLEIYEGLAESTGIDAGLPASARVKYALGDLAMVEHTASYVRSFPYGSGPAYGELLDIAQPDWRKYVTLKTDLPALAAHAYALPPAPVTRTQAYAALNRNGGRAILAQEATRAREVAARNRRYTQEFVAGPTLSIPLGKFQITFDPRDIEQFGTRGSVYHTLHVSGAWGVLDVKGGDVVISPQFSVATVALPAGGLAKQSGTILGSGWRLQLAAGFALAPNAARSGSFTVAASKR